MIRDRNQSNIGANPKSKNKPTFDINFKSLKFNRMEITHKNCNNYIVQI